MAEAGTQKKRARETESSILVEALETKNASVADEDTRLSRKLLSKTYAELLDALSSPTTDGLDTLLAKLRTFSARAGEVHEESPEFLMGGFSALAELCELARHQKVPLSAAEVLIRRRSTADKILGTLARHGSLNVSDLAKAVNKASQNLHAPLKEMTTVNLVRRDDIGNSTLYSVTVLGKAALKWFNEKAAESHAAAKPPVTVTGWQGLTKNISKQLGISEVRAVKIYTSVSRAIKGEVAKKGAVQVPDGGVFCGRINARKYWNSDGLIVVDSEGTSEPNRSGERSVAAEK